MFTDGDIDNVKVQLTTAIEDNCVPAVVTMSGMPAPASDCYGEPAPMTTSNKRAPASLVSRTLLSSCTCEVEWSSICHYNLQLSRCNALRLELVSGD